MITFYGATFPMRTINTIVNFKTINSYPVASAITVSKFSELIFWIVTPCGLVRRYRWVGGTDYLVFRVEAEDVFLRNFGICLQVHAAFNLEDQFRNLHR
jgi:hypothetical protein